jgi:hypothetical protein
MTENNQPASIDDPGEETDIVQQLPKDWIAKRKFAIGVFAKKAGNIAETCKVLGIHRSTWYDWYANDKIFKRWADEVREGLIDFAESKLMQNINDGKETSILFMLRTQGRNRGYIEKQVVEHEGAVPVVDLEQEKRKARQLLAEQEGE